MRKEVKNVLNNVFLEKQEELRDELQDVRREWLLKHQNQLIKEINETYEKEEIRFQEWVTDLQKESKENLYKHIDEIKERSWKMGTCEMEKRTLVLMIERMLEMITKEKKYQHNYLR